MLPSKWILTVDYGEEKKILCSSKRYGVKKRRWQATLWGSLGMKKKGGEGKIVEY